MAGLFSGNSPLQVINNMNRKTIIGFAVAFVVLGVIVMVSISGENENELTVGYAGVSPNDSNHVIIAVTNSSKQSIRFSTDGEIKKFGRFGSLSNTFRHVWLQVPSHNIRLFDQVGRTEGEWRTIVIYQRSAGGSFVWRTCRKLADFASEHHLPWIAHLIGVRPAEITAYGPAMLGNKPAPP
jgi:hypothetical protein